MVRKCKVLGCTAQCQRTFKFPPVNDDRLLVWLSATGNKVLLETPMNKLMHNVICGRHFEPKYVLAKKLSTSAIPTLHLPDPIDASQYLKSWDKENQQPPESERFPSIPQQLKSTQTFGSSQNNNDFNNNEGLQLLPCNVPLKESQSSRVHNLSSTDTASSSGSFDGSGESLKEFLSKDSLSTSDSNPEYKGKISGIKGNQQWRMNKRKGVKLMLLLKKRKLLRLKTVSSEENQHRNMLLHDKKQQNLKRFKTMTHKAVRILTKLYANIFRPHQQSLLKRFTLTATFGKDNLSETVRTVMLLRHQKESQHRRSNMRKKKNAFFKSVQPTTISFNEYIL